jgi:hypothetical protein
MTNYLIIIIAICSTLFSCGKSTKDNSTNGLIIDPSIKAEVEKNISPLHFGAWQDNFLIYTNRMLIDFYEDDKLKISLKEQDNKSTIFKSFYYWQGDTLVIDGAFGLFGGSGFTIKIVKANATLYHMLASDDFPTYAYNERDNLTWRLEIPCTETKIVLSEIPDSTKKQIVYGFVEFKSGDYYARNSSADGQEILPRKKQRANMRIYFKSAYIEF